MTNEIDQARAFRYFNVALDAGCCLRCGLRFSITDLYLPDFDQPEQYINTIWMEQNEYAMGNEQQQTKNENECTAHFSKKLKTSPCVVCLNLLNDLTINTIETQINLNELLDYDCDTFAISITYPLSILVREQAMIMHIKEKINTYTAQHCLPFNKVWIASSKKLLERITQKQYAYKSPLSIHFISKDETDMKLCINEAYIPHLEEAKILFSKQSIVKYFELSDVSVLKTVIQIPPIVPHDNAPINDIKCKHESIYIVGRYCKYLRTLGQTPWIVDGVKMCETSVQEIVFHWFQDIFSGKEMVFTASGREDFDVRMLGHGRPFFVKVRNPKRTKFTFDEFRELENKVKTSEAVSVRDLQFALKDKLSLIKDGEELKKKTYKALCIIERPEKLGSCIQKVNDLCSITILQKTPIRVFHRRSYAERKKTIYSISACPVSGKSNVLQLDLIAQAGTYVKEFVHGDSGRTIPSLGDIIGETVDILALDVVDIELMYPPMIKY